MLFIVSTDLSGIEPHRKGSMGRVVTSGSLGGLMVSTLALNARDVGSIPARGALFLIFITPTTILIQAT